MTDPTDVETPHELVLHNEYPVPPAQVWAAWTDPDQFAQWWVGPGWRTHDLKLDVRPDGRFSARQSADDESMTIPFDGFYREVDAPTLLVIELSDSDDPAEPGRTRMTVRLTATETGTEQEFRQTGVVTDEHFEALKAGTITFMSQLGDFLAR